MDAKLAAERTVFVGRERELDELHRALSEALAGSTRIVLLSGEPGIGKTTLVERFLADTAGTGVRRAKGSGSRLRGTLPFWPWAEAMQQLRPGGGSDRRGDAIDPGQPTLARMFGFESLSPRTAGLERAFLPGEGRFRIFDAATAFIDGVSHDAGLVLVLDDTQHFDQASFGLLIHLAETLRDAPLLLIVSFEEVASADETSNTLSGLSQIRDSRWIRLAPLERDATEALLAALVGRVPSARAVRRVHELAGGNPLFIVELAFELRTGGIDEMRDATTVAASSVPRRARALIARRVARLPAEVLGVLGAAAVIGPTFSAEFLGHVAGLAPGHALELLGAAQRSDLVTPLDDRPDLFTFRHGLVRDALEGGLDPGARLQLHRRVGKALENLLSSQRDVTPGTWAALAWHWHQAGDRPRTARYATLAGDEAMEQSAFEEAVRMYQLGVSVSRLGFLPAPERAVLSFRLANAEYELGDVGDASKAIVAGTAEAHRARRLDLLVHAPLITHDTGNTVVSASLLTSCEGILADMSLPHGVRSRLLAQRAVILSESGRAAEAIVDSDSALALVDTAEDPDLVTWLMPARHLVLAGPEWPGERITLANQALDLTRAKASPAMEFAARTWRLDAYWELGDLPAVEAELNVLDGLGARVHHPQAHWTLGRARAALALMRGRFDEALRRSEAATNALPATDFTAQLLHLAFTGLVAAETGDPGWLDVAGDVLEQVPGILGRCLKGRVLLALGGEDEARACLDQARSQAERVPRDARWMPTVVLLADLATELEDRSTAEICYDALLPFRDRLAASGGGTIACLGAVSFFLGRIATLLGKYDQAELWLGDAAARHAAAGARPWSVRGRLARAEVLYLRGGGTQRAIQLARQAAETASGLGMTPLVRRARQLADAWSSASGPLGGLSPREREIAALVARGLTNRQIGSTLYIAPRTAENHVQHILTKLGFSSRAEIAAWAVREQLVTGSHNE